MKFDLGKLEFIFYKLNKDNIEKIMDKLPRLVVIGATSAIAKECIRYWIKSKACDVTLVGRNESDLVRLSNDLSVRNPNIKVHIETVDFLSPHAIKKTIDVIFDESPISLALIAHGSLPNQEECQESLSLANDALQINGVSPILFSEAIIKKMSESNYGTLAIIGSVAGDRGRKSNYLYGCAKSMLETYVQGLQHRFASSLIRVVLIKPGPTDTPMTSHLKSQGANLASPNEVAKNIIDGIENGKSVIYVPGKWKIIMLVVRNIPSFLFNKLNI